MLKILPIAALTTLLCLPAGAATLGVNLVINGDAETGDVNGWVNPDGISAITDPGGDPEVASGTYAFTAGAGPSTATISQTIDLSALSSIIDLGTTSFDATAQVQSRFFGGVLDSVALSFSFLDSIGDTLLLAGPLLDSTPSPFAFEAVSRTGFVPTNTRSILVEAVFRRTGFSSTDAYLDDISLVLISPEIAPVPLPASLAFLGLSLGALGILRRRQRS